MKINLTNWLIIFSLCLTTHLFSYNKTALEYLKSYKKVRSNNSDDLDFSYANLAGIDLSNVKLARANLTGADLSGANLSGADLTEAICYNCNMRGASLRGASLIRSKGFGVCVGADFSGADLSNSVLHGDYSNTKFDHANLYNVKFESAFIVGASFRAADLSRVNFFCADIRNTDFSDANLSQADFHSIIKHIKESKNGNMKHVYFDSNDWDTINFTGADLGGAYMSGCLITRSELIKKGAVNTNSISSIREY